MEDKKEKDYEKPSCLNYIHQPACPCEYSCCNAACLVIYKPKERRC